MARTVTLLQLRSDIRSLADIKGLTVRHPDSDLNRFINQSIQRFREKVSNRGIAHYLVHTTGTLTPGITSPFAFTVLDLSAVVPAVVRVYGLDITYQGRVVPLTPCNFDSRNDFQRGDSAAASCGVPEAFANYQTSKVAILPASDAAYAYTAFYLPVLTDLAADIDTFDGISGWEQWVVWDVLVKLISRDKYGQEYTMCVQERELVWRDIEPNASPVKRGGAVRRYDARELRGLSGRRSRGCC